MTVSDTFPILLAEGMTTFSVLYLVCFFVGLAFAVLSGLFAGVFGGHAGGHMDIGGHDAGGMSPDVGSVTDGAVHFSPLSPTTIAMFITAFGGVGYILEEAMALPLLVHLGGATVSGFVVAGLTFAFFYKLFRSVQATSQPTMADVIGSEAEVIAAIPAGGSGEIAYTVRGTRQNAAARTDGGVEIPYGRTVVIQRMAAGVCYVVSK